MIIEFYGLPGTGKTTVARQLKKEGNFEIIKIKNKNELFWYNFLFLLKHPIKFLALLFIVFNNSTSTKEFYYKFMNSFLDVNAKHQKAKKFKYAIIDQGYCQGTISIFKNYQNSKSIERYKKLIISPDKLFIFKISEDNSIKRTIKRGYYVREGFSKNYMDNFKKIMIKNNDLFISLNHNANFVFIIDSNQELDNVYNNILTKIK